MKFVKSTFGFGAFVLVCLTVAATATAAITGWRGLSQHQRNSQILARAQQDDRKNTGKSCKEWVRDVVRGASAGEVHIPSTKSNDYEWNSHPKVARMQKPFPINWVQPGQIIQMRWKNQTRNREVNPHTAIVVSTSRNKMTWIDCNWSKDQKVKIHDITFRDFESCVGNNYTVYEIR